MCYMEDSVFLRRMLLKCTLENHDVVCIKLNCLRIQTSDWCKKTMNLRFLLN
jgi:hypothetical protein